MKKKLPYINITQHARMVKVVPSVQESNTAKVKVEGDIPIVTLIHLAKGNISIPQT